MSGWQTQSKSQGSGGPALGVLLVMLLVLSVGAHAEDLYVGQGLASGRNFQPLQGLSLQMPVDTAIPLKPGELVIRGQFTETSTALLETEPTGNGVLKDAQLTTTLALRYGTPIQNVEVGLELESLYRHSSGLDGLITAVEHLVSRPNGPRGALKNSGYAYSLNSFPGNTSLNPPNDAFGLGDIVVHAKALMVSEGQYTPATSLRVALSVPVGDKSRAFGTGVADVGVGLSLQKTVWDRLALYVNLNEILPTGHYFGLAQRGYFTSVTGVEFMATPKFSIIGQFDYYQSPFGNTGLQLLDNGVTEVVLAFGYRFTPNLLWQIYGVENLDFTTGSAADFSLGTALTYRIPQK
jgi:hypothetical protein